MTASRRAPNIYHFQRGGMCKNTYLFSSRLSKDVIDWHVCQLSKGHAGWCKCWCECLFDDYGIIGLQDALFRDQVRRHRGNP